jgi:hypothetical protein
MYRKIFAPRILNWNVFSIVLGDGGSAFITRRCCKAEAIKEAYRLQLDVIDATYEINNRLMNINHSLELNNIHNQILKTNKKYVTPIYFVRGAYSPVSCSTCSCFKKDHPHILY